MHDARFHVYILALLTDAFSTLLTIFDNFRPSHHKIPDPIGPVAKEILIRPCILKSTHSVGDKIQKKPFDRPDGEVYQINFEYVH